MSGSSTDLSPGGVRNTITWTDTQSSVGTVTYTIKRNTSNSLVGATVIQSNIASGTQRWNDDSVTHMTTYYYFIEATNGVETVVTTGFELYAVWDKYALNKNYQNKHFASLVFNPLTESFDEV
ncbi:hypothetical protein [Solibacillus daqui]|uniref:hypothetical protein n=1 Tax=Solibacillus daqui TaxID=2912187 RepID=UPI0023655939|nr:hypothetical protein [Solibacillus daqui]